MITKIITIEDVKDFARQLTAEGVSFHPDDDFKEYINFSTNEPIYNIEEAEFRNNLINDCFVVCEKVGADIYEIMFEELLKESGSDKIIRLPSTE